MSSEASPEKRMRPCTDSTVRPGEVRRIVPPICIVFHGVPRPASRPAGHWPMVVLSCGSTFTATRPQPGVMRARTSPRRQQAWRSRSSGVRPAKPSRQCRRSGSAAASRLPAPPVSTGSALPLQTVPRASVSSSRPPVAASTREASQPAGTKATSPASAPITAPMPAQRCAEVRTRCQASSASVVSAKPVRAKRPGLRPNQPLIALPDADHEAPPVPGICTMTLPL